MKSQTEERIKELVQDKAFLEAVSKLTTKEEVKQAFAEKSVTLNDADIDFLYKTIITKELPDEALENVAGGSIRSAILKITSGVLEIGTEIFNSVKKQKN